MTVVQLSEWRKKRGSAASETSLRPKLFEAPEATLVVSFSGLTEEQQRAAIAGFPGGRRFRLHLERGGR